MEAIFSFLLIVLPFYGFCFEGIKSPFDVFVGSREDLVPLANIKKNPALALSGGIFEILSITSSGLWVECYKKKSVSLVQEC